ncbi:MAG: hypothetical protein U0599_29175 [Vicinamibacteria bacterium]
MVTTSVGITEPSRWRWSYSAVWVRAEASPRASASILARTDPEARAQDSGLSTSSRLNPRTSSGLSPRTARTEGLT